MDATVEGADLISVDDDLQLPTAHIFLLIVIHEAHEISYSDLWPKKFTET